MRSTNKSPAETGNFLCAVRPPDVAKPSRQWRLEQEPAPSLLSAPARTAYDGDRLPRREHPASPSPVPTSKAGKSRRVVRIVVTAPDARMMRANRPRLHQVDPDIFLHEKETAPCRSR